MYEMTRPLQELDAPPTLQQILAMPGRRLREVHAELPQAPKRPDGTVDAQYLSLRKQGISIRSSWGTILCVWLYTAMERHERYQGEMPWGISFGMSRAQMRDMLGQPVGGGEEMVDQLIGVLLARDIWAIERWNVHAEYKADEVVRISFMLIDDQD